MGIEFPDGSVMGDSGNIKLRFDDRYMKMAAEGGVEPRAVIHKCCPYFELMRH